MTTVSGEQQHILHSIQEQHEQNKIVKATSARTATTSDLINMLISSMHSSLWCLVWLIVQLYQNFSRDNWGISKALITAM